MISRMWARLSQRYVTPIAASAATSSGLTDMARPAIAFLAPSCSCSFPASFNRQKNSFLKQPRRMRVRA
jgi:hypothetical protein